MYNVLKDHAKIEINEKIFCYFQIPKSMSDFWLNALALKSWESVHYFLSSRMLSFEWICRHNIIENSFLHTTSLF